MKIENKDLVALRKRTGISIMECRNALLKADGDLKKAEEILTKEGENIAQKKTSRLSGQGLIESYIHLGGKIGVLLEISCETDFVARNEEFANFAHDIAMHIAASYPRDPKELLEQPFIKDEDIQVKTLLTNLISKIGENIEIKRFTRYEIGRK